MPSQSAQLNVLRNPMSHHVTYKEIIIKHYKNPSKKGPH